MGNLYDKLGEYENLDELNYLASKLDDMSRDEYNHFLAAMEVSDHTGSIQELINLTENMDCYDVYPDIEDHDDLGRFYIEEMGAMEVPEYLRTTSTMGRTAGMWPWRKAATLRSLAMCETPGIALWRCMTATGRTSRKSTES